MISSDLSNIDAFIFDLGNTLYHQFIQLVDQNQCFLTELGLDDSCDIPGEEIRRALDYADNWLYDMTLKNNVEVTWEPVRETWVEYDYKFLEALGFKDNLQHFSEELQKKWDEFVGSRKPELIEGVKLFLEKMKDSGFILAIASNRFGDPKSNLVKDEILSLFDSIHYTNIPGYKKPSPYMLLQASHDIKVNPMRCAYVGNMVRFDVIAAQRAGMVPILVSGCNPEEKEKASDGILILDNVSEIPEILNFS